ncbi:hypothetical protein D3C80_1492900 [compost metagenome]
MNCDQFGIFAVVYYWLVAERLQVVEHFPEFGHFLRVRVNGQLAANSHGAQLAKGAFVLAVSHWHDHSQRVYQGHHLGVVLDDPLDADLAHFAQRLLMHLYLGTEDFHNLLLSLGCHQQEVAHFAGLQVVQVVSGRTAVAGDLRAHEVQLDDTSEDGLRRND